MVRVRVRVRVSVRVRIRVRVRVRVRVSARHHTPETVGSVQIGSVRPFDLILEVACCHATALHLHLHKCFHNLPCFFFKPHIHSANVGNTQ